MPLTAAEKQKRRRVKLKSEGKYEEFKKLHLEEGRKSQQKQKQKFLQLSQHQQPLLLEDRRAKTRERVRKRTQCKCKISILLKLVCHCISHLVLWVKPQDKPTGSCHLHHDAKSYLFSDLCSLSDGKSERPSHGSSPQKRGLTFGTRELITGFYCLDDVGHQSPGRKDTMMVREKDSSYSSLIPVHHGNK